MKKRSRFVRPHTVVLDLSDGDSIIVKERLTWGERRAAFGRMWNEKTEKINPLETGMGLVTAYLVDWNLCDDDGKPIDIRGKTIQEVTDILDAFEGEDFKEIKDAISAHEDRMDALRAAEKNDQGGESSAAAISSSPSAAAGASSGFAH
jgi:hypothetical protein